MDNTSDTSATTTSTTTGTGTGTKARFRHVKVEQDGDTSSVAVTYRRDDGTGYTDATTYALSDIAPATLPDGTRNPQYDRLALLGFAVAILRSQPAADNDKDNDMASRQVAVEDLIGRIRSGDYAPGRSDYDGQPTYTPTVQAVHKVATERGKVWTLEEAKGWWDALSKQDKAYTARDPSVSLERDKIEAEKIKARNAANKKAQKTEIASPLASLF